MDELTPERAVRLLRAKAAELENLVLGDYESNSQYPTHIRDPRLTDLTAAVALVATLLADCMERTEPQYPPPSWPLENQRDG